MIHDNKFHHCTMHTWSHHRERPYCTHTHTYTHTPPHQRLDQVLGALCLNREGSPQRLERERSVLLSQAATSEDENRKYCHTKQVDDEGATCRALLTVFSALRALIASGRCSFAKLQQRRMNRMNVGVLWVQLCRTLFSQPSGP